MASPRDLGPGDQVAEQMREEAPSSGLRRRRFRSDRGNSSYAAHPLARPSVSTTLVTIGAVLIVWWAPARSLYFGTIHAATKFVVETAARIFNPEPDQPEMATMGRPTEPTMKIIGLDDPAPVERTRLPPRPEHVPANLTGPAQDTGRSISIGLAP